MKHNPLYLRAIELAKEGVQPRDIRTQLGSASVGSVKAMLSRCRRLGHDVPRFMPDGSFRDTYERKNGD